MRVKLVGLLAAMFSFMSFAGLSLSAEVHHAGDPTAGAAYAKQYCAKCHAINRGETSPEPTAPPFIGVANKKGMTATALTVWLTTSHPTMPNIVIDPHDMDKVVAFILSLKKE